MPPAVYQSPPGIWASSAARRLTDPYTRFWEFRWAAAIERFWGFVEKVPFETCWIWTGGLNSAGYGRFNVRGRRVLAHRWIYAERHRG